jgi:TonB family protein
VKERPPKKDYLAQLKVDVDFEKDKPKEAVEEPEKPKAVEEPSPEDIVDAPPTVNEPPPPDIPKQREPEKRPNPQVAKANNPAPKDPGRPQAPKGNEEIAKRRAAVVDKTVLKALMGSGEAGPGDVGINQGAAAKYATAFDYDGKNPAAMNAPEEKAFGGGPAAGEGGDGGGGPKAQTITAEERKQAGIGQPLKTDTVAKAPTKAPTEKKVEAKISLAGGAKKGGGLGKLDTAQVSSVFKRRASAFKACYESRLRDKPNLGGKIVIRFTIGGAGRVTNIDVASNTTGDTAVGACIVEKVRGMKFDKPENGDVSFTYPIVLSKGN